MLLKIIKLSALGAIAATVFFWGVALFLDMAGILPLHQVRSSFSFFPEQISLKAALRDADELFSTLERVHPDVGINIGQDGYIKLKSLTIAEINKKGARDGRIKVRDLAYILYYAAAAIGDGHTSISYTCAVNAKDTQKRFPPFALAAKDGKFIIAEAPDVRFDGAEVTAINGTPFKEFIKPALERISGETAKFKAYQFARHQEFWWDFSGLLAGLSEFDLTVRAPGGALKTFKVAAVGPVEFSRFGVLNASRRGSSLAIYYKTGIGWFNYGEFEKSAVQRTEIDNIFKRVKKANIKDLVLDLRGNLGGDSSMGDLIFSYITRTKIIQLSGKVKLSKELIKSQPQLKKFEGHEGEVANNPGVEAMNPVPEAFFGGKVYLLVDNGTYSSASAFAAAFRDYNIGEIIGYETGEPPIAFGNAIRLSLRHSGIKYLVSACTYSPFKPRPGDNIHGVIPDVPLNDDLLRPHNGSAQAFVLDRILKRRAQKTIKP